MVFDNNFVTTQGGAIHVVYNSRQNLKTDSKCFIRHVDPTITPDNWNVSMEFTNNVGFKGSLNNSIFVTSLLSCSVLGGSRVITAGNKSAVFCWKGWAYYTSGVPVDCESQIASDIGNITYSGGGDAELRDRVQSFPGWNFDLPLAVWDDFHSNISDQTVFSSTSDISEKVSIVYGETSVNGQENSTYHMMLESTGQRVWYADVYVDLQRCPPGYTFKDDMCMCGGNYGGTVICNIKAKEVHLSKHLWMGLYNDSYYTIECPPKHCLSSGKSRFITLPNSSDALSKEICTPNRKGFMCSECSEGYGPAVNSETFDCVNCTDINLTANIAKYVASIYLPLVVLFTILIVFDVRLTTGPANSFILYCQVVSSATFGLDADGRITLQQFSTHYRKYDSAYKFPYGIFNLEFIENYIPSLCLSSSINTLMVLCLDYCVAILPLIMIIVVLTIIELKGRCCSVREISLAPKSYNFLQSKIRNIGAALLPAFASFLLLSYTKFSTVSTYIVATRSLIDENGDMLRQPQFVYLAGQYKSTDEEYQPYFVTAIVVFCTFVAIPPLLLLDYPLRAVEWVILKSRHIRRIYPTVKIRIFLDTFQGCYRKNMRFFAGIYFLFRLLINLFFFLSGSWPKQFVVQQILCCLMTILVALCQPYERKFLNYVDTLMFANLSILTCLSHYLYEVFNSQEAYHPPVQVFNARYFLISLPLVYMVCYILWSKTKPYHKLMLKKLLITVLRCCRRSPQYSQLDTIARRETVTATGTAATSIVRDAASSQPRDAVEAFFARAEERNSYLPTLPVTVVGLDADGSCNGEASVYQTADTQAQVENGRKNSLYGSIETSTD